MAIRVIRPQLTLHDETPSLARFSPQNRPEPTWPGLPTARLSTLAQLPADAHPRRVPPAGRIPPTHIQTDGRTDTLREAVIIKITI